MRKAPYLLLSFFLVVADQISKWAVSEHVMRPAIPGGGDSLTLSGWYALAPGRLPYAEIEVLPFFNIVMVWNKGISFGLLNRDTDYGPTILIALALAITALFLTFMRKTSAPLQLTGIALIIGGALGNVIDRLRFGAVMDFLDFHAGNYHWPAFNIADSCVCIGVAILIIKGLAFDRPT